MTHRIRLLLVYLAALYCGSLGAQQPFLSEQQWVAIRSEASGAAPYENLRILTRLHRVPATAEFDQAADYMLARAKEYGLRDAHAEQFPIDGKLHYGLMRSHFAWSVEAGSLWQTEPDHTLIGDWATDPIRLADYSHSADVHAALIDVGMGTREADYQGKDIRNKIVLADGVLSLVQQLAVINHGAAGIVSDMPNQTTAWSGLDPSIVRWGHLDATLPTGFAFMVSPGTAAGLRAQLALEKPVLLSAHITASVEAGHWTVVTGTIPGTNPQAGEVVYTCHLDHQRPGANDNGSGCVSILETARVLTRLIERGQLPRPVRTIRFIWGPEVEGTMAFLSKHPEVRHALRADVHMDMVGGDPYKNKSILHVTETPWSLPSFVTDVGDLFAETLRNAAATYAEEGSNPEAAVIEERDGASGTRNEFLVDETPYAEGSDHDDYDSSTIAVPSLYLRDWPDIYIHTNHDTLDKIDPTKLRRVVVLGAASGYTYASLDASRAEGLLAFSAARGERRIAQSSERALRLLGETQVADSWYEARNTIVQTLAREQAELTSVATYTGSQPAQLEPLRHTLDTLAAAHMAAVDAAAVQNRTSGATPSAPWRAVVQASLIPTRNPSESEFGPLTYQNDDVLRDRLGREREDKIKLLSGSSRLLRVQDSGALYTYEILNLVNGKRTMGEIRDVVSAEYGPIPIELVLDYLQACKEAGIVAFR